MKDTELYEKILGLEAPWGVKSVELAGDLSEVHIGVEYGSKTAPCPECGRSCTLHDHAPERKWRHLDTCQMRTILVSRAPRTTCPEHGVKTLQVPWAEPHGRFTLMFEALCILWLQAAQKKGQVAKLLQLSFDEIDHIQQRAVQRGLDRRMPESVKRIGLDEKSMRRGHDYMSVLMNLDAPPRVIDVAEGRTTQSAQTLLSKAFNQQQRAEIECACMDMWKPYMTAVAKQLPNADIVHDRFHVSMHLNEAIDQTRRREQRKLAGQGEPALKHSRYLFLWNFETLPDHRYVQFQAASRVAEKTATVWRFKELFRGFWEQRSVLEALRYLKNWAEQAVQHRIPALTKVANRLLRHADGLASYAVHRITNAATEGFNGKIQQLKTNARGFKSFSHYRRNILFYYGGLDMNPLKTQ